MKETIVETLMELMGIDSDHLADKGAIVEFCNEWLGDCGMEVTVHGEECPAIEATAGTGLIMSGHLDVVPTGEGWTRGQGEREGDIVYGRGTADMKGAVAAMLHAARTLSEEGVPFSVFLTTDEEEGMRGALRLSRSPALKEAPGVMIGEPTDMRVVSEEKGVYRFRLTTRGKAAHSSQPWLGDNAISRMQVLLSLMDDLATTPGAPTDGMTMCYTTISGGTKNNVVPESCRAEVDVRFPASMDLEEVESLVDGRLQGEEYRMDHIARLNSFRAPEDSGMLSEIIDQLGTGKVKAAFATEAARFSEANPQVYICGPGPSGVCHIADEWVDVGQLERYYRLLIHMARFAQG
ncbi:MAG: M20 family metallopeptidase [Methanomassiliicoccales archaeon]